MTSSVPGPGAGTSPADDAAAFRAIAEAAGDAAFIIDTPTRTFRYLSPSVEQLVGFSPDDFTRALAVTAPQGPLAPMLAGLDERLRRFAAGDHSPMRVVREFDIQRPDGKTASVQVISTLLLDQSGDPVAIAGMIRDQSERRTREAEQKRFASMLNHEFRTPLSTIDGAIQRLEATSASADEPTRQRYRKIAAAVDRLIGMLDQYLSPDRMAALGRERAPNSVSPRTLLDEAAALARAAGRPVQLNAENNLPSSLRADPAGLRLAIKVLLDNALAFSPPGSPVELSGRALEKGIELCVRDHGPGVPVQDASRIFDKNYRGSNAHGIPGSGLGLYMARSVLEVHGGTIELGVPPSEGAVFKIFLPSVIIGGKVVASGEPNSDNRFNQAGGDAQASRP